MIRHESKPISIHINPHKVSSSIYIYKSIPNHTKSKEISGSSGNPPITRVAWHRSCRTWWHASPGRLCGTSPWCYRFSHGKTAGFQGRSPAETMGFAAILCQRTHEPMKAQKRVDPGRILMPAIGVMHGIRFRIRWPGFWGVIRQD